MKKALITGITGQDGSYLAELLLSKGYEVHGIVRRSSSFNTSRINHIFDRLILHYADLSDSSSLYKLIVKIEPDEVYNLGAQSHVRVSFDIPEYTADVDALGTLRILEAIRDINPKIRYYQASSSEMFGSAVPPQSELTRFEPRSPYACAKVFSYYTTINYRESYGIHASNGILFNHESERRGETFVTRKITKGLANIIKGKQDRLVLGNLRAKRDWGHAEDYVYAMWLMLQADKPGDYVVATGESYSVEQFLEESFGLLCRDYRQYVDIDPKYFRPAEVDFLLGDPSKIKRELGWEPKVSFKQLVERMVKNDVGMV